MQEPQKTPVQSWIGKIPWRRKWQPALVFLSGKCHEQRSLVGYCSWRHQGSDMMEHTHTHTHTHTINYPPILIKPFFIGLYFKISAVGQVKFASSGTNSSVQFSHSVVSDSSAVIKVPATQMVSYSPGGLENNLTQTCCVK